MALITDAKEFEHLASAESVEHVDPKKRYMLLDDEGIPYSVPGAKVAQRVAEGAKLGTAEDIATHHERFATSQQEGAHPYLSPIAAAAAPFVEQAAVIPGVGGAIERFAVKQIGEASGLNEEESRAFVERSENAHPWIKAGGQLAGFAAGTALLAPLKVAGLAAKAGELATGGEALEALKAAAEAGEHVKDIGIVGRALLGSATKEAVLASAQGLAAGANEAVARDPGGDAERMLSSAAAGGAWGAGTGAIFGAIGAMGAAGLVKGGKALARKASVAYDRAAGAMADMAAGEEGVAPPTVKRKAFLHLLGMSFGKGRVAGTVANMEPAELKEAEDLLMANIDELGGMSQYKRAAAIPKLAEQHAEALHQQILQEGGAGAEAVEGARVRAVLESMGVRQHIVGQNTMDRMVDEIGIDRVKRIADRLVSDDVVKTGDTVSGAWKKALAKQAEHGKAMERVLETLDASGVDTPDVAGIAKRIAEQVGPRLEKETVLGLRKSELERLHDIVIDPMMSHAEKAGSSWEYVIKARREIGKELFKTGNRELREAYAVFNDEIQSAMGKSQVGADLLDEWKAANEGWSDYQTIRDRVIPPSALGHGPKVIDLEKHARDVINTKPSAKDYLKSIPADSPLAQKYEAALRSTISLNKLADVGQEALKKRVTRAGLEWDSGLAKTLGSFGKKSFLAGGGLAMGKVLAPESAADLQEWAHKHPAAAVGVGLAAMVAMSGAGKAAASKAFANFVMLGQKEAMKGLIIASHKAEEAATASAKEIFAEMATVKGATGVGIHHTGEEAAAKFREGAEHAEGAEPLGKGLIKQAWQDAASPENAVTGIAEALAPMTAILPQASAYTQASLSRDRQYLATQAPKAGPSGYFDPPHEPSPYQEKRMEQIYGAMYDTHAALKSFTRPGFVPQHILDAIRETRPAVYQDYSQAILSGVTTLKDRGQVPSHQDRLRLGKILQMPLDLSEEPATRVAFAQFWAAQGPQAEEHPQLAPKGRKKPKGAERRSGSEIAASGE